MNLSFFIGILAVLSTPGAYPLPAADGTAAVPDAPGQAVPCLVPAFSLVLGRPTAVSVDVGVLAETDLEGWFEFGADPAGLTGRTLPAIFPANIPETVTLGSLQPDTRYFFRFYRRPTGNGDYTLAAEASFQTQRAPGRPFTFTVQADPHVGDTGFVPALYQRTLEGSTARFRFVFIHHLAGGLNPEARGGVEAVPYYEWGGLNADGSPGFTARRPGWPLPVHDLLKANGVSAVFHGHDHVFVRQERDGIVYQECPRPSFNQADAVADATAAGYASGVVLPSPGHLRVRVTPSQATVEYVRASLTDPNANGTVVYRYTLLPAADLGAFPGNVVLGCPTAASVNANLFSPGGTGEVFLEYGPITDPYSASTPPVTLAAGVPLEIRLDGLSANTAYLYRTRFRATGATDFSPGLECRFHTARASGDTFTFCVQGDSHPERANSQFDADLYARTLLTAAADLPDFYFALGDDFSVDTLDPATVTEAQVIERYVIQRPFLGLIGSGAPVYLVNGNHEQAARYLLNGTPDSVAVWAQNARNRYYSQPAPDGFYTGNTEWVSFIGVLRNYYAWTWGDALFVTIDPYWGSPICVDNPFYGGPKHPEPWDITLGEAQYRWLKNTLERSGAKYKFVFAHHVHGTGRGGIEQADLYEWGGWNRNGGWGFDTRRPGWPETIHQLMASTGVTVFFQGHDHIWVRQVKDGVIYQTLPEPADPNYTLYNADAFDTGDKLSNTGYTRVTISPSGGQVDYVRTYLPEDEGPGRISGAVAFSYPIQPTGIQTARCGDADGSGGVDATDLLRVAHYLDGDAIAEVSDVPYLDLDGSGALDIGDLLLLQLSLAGQIDMPECSGL